MIRLLLALTLAVITSPAWAQMTPFALFQSTLTRPANTTAYGGTVSTPQLIASSTTAGSIVVPTFNIQNPNTNIIVPGGSLVTNVTTGWGGVALLIDLWTNAPTFSNGDGGTYAVATGSTFQRAQYSCTLVQNADGATCQLVPVGITAPMVHPSTNNTGLIYWDIQIQSSATPISGQTFTLLMQAWNY